MVKLIAFDEEDLGVLSFCLQNARVQVKNMLRQKQQKRFLLLLRCFENNAFSADTIGAEALSAKQKAQKDNADKVERQAIEIPLVSLYVLHFDHVIAAYFLGIDRGQEQNFLTLAGVLFHKKHAPGGIIEILFAENAALRLEVECIEARLQNMSDLHESGKQAIPIE